MSNSNAALLAGHNITIRARLAIVTHHLNVSPKRVPIVAHDKVSRKREKNRMRHKHRGLAATLREGKKRAGNKESKEQSRKNSAHKVHLYFTYKSFLPNYDRL